MAYDVIFDDEAKEDYWALDYSVRLRIEKKLLQLGRVDLTSRHLRHGSPHFVAEVGQYRIAYKILDDRMIKRVMFVGDHKAYERWYRERDLY